MNARTLFLFRNSEKQFNMADTSVTEHQCQAKTLKEKLFASKPCVTLCSCSYC